VGIAPREGQVSRRGWTVTERLDSE
jgi:hypothetical protein